MLAPGQPYSVVAKQDITFAAAGLDTSSVLIIYKVDGAYMSFRPERPINAITAFQANKGYNIILKRQMDLSGILAPPLPTGSDDTPQFRYVTDTGGILVG